MDPVELKTELELAKAENRALRQVVLLMLAEAPDPRTLKAIGPCKVLLPVQPATIESARYLLAQ
jgi:hypothetical protein